jgi:hypothetical protein
MEFIKRLAIGVKKIYGSPTRFMGSKGKTVVPS